MSDKGNTIGRLYGPTPMSDVPAADANPPIVAETPEEAAWIASIHNGLDALGAIPEVGAVFDGANALIYAVEGNAVQAGISGGAAALDLIPGVGTAGKVAEFGIKGAAKLAAKDAAEQIAKHEAEHLAGQEAKKIAEQEAKQGEKTVGNEAKPWKGEDGAKVNGKPKRPSWRQSEKDVGQKLEEGYKEQRSVKDGKEVSYGTKGSTRPDWYKDGSSVEVKNYNIETPAGQGRFIENVSNQAIYRATQLPPKTMQSLFIDVRGQQVSLDTLDNVVQSIATKSNGIIQPSNISILR